MKQKQDGRGVPDYVEEVEDELRDLTREKGQGGKGNHESLSDAELRGVTPDLAAERAKDGKMTPDPGEG